LQALVMSLYNSLAVAAVVGPLIRTKYLRTTALAAASSVAVLVGVGVGEAVGDVVIEGRETGLLPESEHPARAATAANATATLRARTNTAKG